MNTLELHDRLGAAIQRQRLVDTAMRLIAVPSPTGDAGAAEDQELVRLISAVAFQRQSTIALDLAGANAAATLKDDPWAENGFNFLERQTSGIGGGTTEMARNNIAEKVLRMPREITHDKNMPFRDVPKGPPAG